MSGRRTRRRRIVAVLGIGLSAACASLLGAALYREPGRSDLFLALQGTLALLVLSAGYGARAIGGDLARVLAVPIRNVLPNPYQPRQAPEPDSLEGLVRSIQEYNVIVPIIVRRRGRKFELVAGQRRLMACKRAGRSSVPAVVLELNDQEVLEVSLLENLQRAPLSVVEQSEVFQRLSREFESVPPEELARRMGLPDDWVERHRKLLALAPVVKQAVQLGLISAGHAEVLAELPSGQQTLLLQRIHQERLSPEALREIAQPS